MRAWSVGVVLVGGIALLAGCSGVTPSLKVGALHRATGDELALTSSTGAFKIEALGYGGSLELKFPEEGVVVVPCGLLVHTAIGSTTEKQEEDGQTNNTTKSFYMTEIPGQLCVEINTGGLAN